MKNLNYAQIVRSEFLELEEVNHFQKVLFADEVYELLKEAYKNVVGGIAFKNSKELVETTDKWELVFFENDLVGAIIYKAKKGFKMVAMGIKTSLNKKIRNFTKEIIGWFFRLNFKQSWMEVSEAAEKFILKYGGEKYLIPNTYASKLTGKEILELCDDGYHYKRVIQGIVKTKVLVGNPNQSI